MDTSYLGQQNLPRGLRNNNPGNIRAGDSWMGLTGADADGFCIFSSLPWGIRALALNFSNAVNNDGRNTITAYITNYAPPSENDTASYIANVAAVSGIDPNQVLTPDYNTVFAIVKAQISEEIGPGYMSYVSDSDINEGLSLMNLASAVVAQVSQAAAANPGGTIFVILLTGLGLLSLSRGKP